MTIPKINSAHGSDTRNIINRAIDSINVQGKSIQDLVAEGQLTEEQYSNLITIVNDMLKSGEVGEYDLTPELRAEVNKVKDKINKGDVSVYDIDKNKGKFDQTWMAEEFLQQILGNTPLNAVPADGSLTTGKYADRSVSRRKLSDEMSGFNNHIITPEYASYGLRRIVETNGENLVKRTTLNYNSDGEVEEVVVEVDGRMVRTDINYSNGLLLSVKNNYEGGN